MTNVRTCLIAMAFIVGAQIASAQDLSRYRGYVLNSSLEAVLATSAARPADAKVLHTRPAKIQELDWRAPYVGSRDGMADPVRGAVFSFLDNALYQVVVSYDPSRTDGLTDGDIVESLTVVYGQPVARSARTRPPAALPDTAVLAQWDSKESSVTLLRGAYAADLQLVLMSKASSTRARTAIREAARMDALDAPRVELEQRKKEVADAAATRAKTRTTNKAAFRP